MTSHVVKSIEILLNMAMVRNIESVVIREVSQSEAL